MASTSDPITYEGTGFGVEPCPGCKEPLEPGQQRTTVPGIWRVWHTDCYEMMQELL